MKRQPTFQSNGQILVGVEAIQAWRDQPARCNCGSHGDEDNAISGSVRNMPAKWLGCNNCSGSACGHPLVYRTQSQINYAREQIEQARPEVMPRRKPPAKNRASSTSSG